MKEIWKAVKGFEGRYEVSNLGNVRSLNYNKTQTVRLLSQTETQGYKYVSLNKKGKSYRMRVHRLVAEAFIPNPNNYPYINHKDENRGNNNFTNLEWCSAKYNINYGNCLKHRSEKRFKPVIATLPNGITEYYKSIKEASFKVGGYQQNITKCLYGERKTTCGRRWSFTNEVFE